MIAILYHKIIVAIKEMIKTMKQIDETIDTHGGWPIKIGGENDKTSSEIKMGTSRRQF